MKEERERSRLHMTCTTTAVPELWKGVHEEVMDKPR